MSRRQRSYWLLDLRLPEYKNEYTVVGSGCLKLKQLVITSFDPNMTFQGTAQLFLIVTY